MDEEEDPPEKASRLFDLPGELRNRIYRYALLEDQIIITTFSFTEPGILRACKLTRHEAGPIFYEENQFELVVRDYDSTAIMRWERKSSKLKAEFKIKELCVRVCKGPQTPHWANLRLTALRLYKGEISVFWEPPTRRGILEFTVIRSLLKMAERFHEIDFEEEGGAAVAKSEVLKQRDQVDFEIRLENWHQQLSRVNMLWG